jgi:predicted transcriptional regulator
MRVKRIQIGIKDLKTMLGDFVKTGEAIDRGEKVKPVKGAKVYFTSFEALRKVLTPKRLELLHTIKTKKPESINELARMAKRDLKNVSDDVKYLERVGLIEKKETGKKTAPVVTYDKLMFEMAV